MMNGKFYAIGSFFVRSRNLFVVVGDVTEGAVTPGMTVEVALNGSLSVSEKVASVEVISVAFRAQDYLGLAFAHEDREDLEFWSNLKISDETLALSWPDRAECRP